MNKGLAAVQIAQLNLSGQPFSLAGSSSLPVTIAVGATYTLNVQFNPAAAGTATGQLTIASDSATPVITLNGTGTAGASSSALSGIYCSSGAMTGSGTDVCTLTLTAAAPGNGLTVNLSSSSSAVTVPSTVIVPANATSAGFTATVSSVETAQVATMTASTSGMLTSFTLQLNAAILALSINATSVAFGDVLVNTPATQSVTMTSTGTVPVTINGATLTGAAFTMPGEAFPVTLSPGQGAMLNLAFDPTTAGTATGQLTIASNSSTDGTAVIALTGTGTAAPVVAVALTPTNPSVTTGTTQQFSASVTGTSNTSVTWTASGTGCSGTACGTISSTGLYTAPAKVPSSASVTITATSQSDPTKSTLAVVSIVPPQADGDNLAWEDTFTTLSYCTTSTPGCNWYGPGLWESTSGGVVSDPYGTYANLNWTSGQGGGAQTTNISTTSANGSYYHAWTFGYTEISMCFNPNTGNYISLWMLPISIPQTGQNYLNQSGGEIDLFEWFGVPPATLGSGTVHVWQNGKNIGNNNGSDAWPFPNGTNLACPNYNTYGMLWTPTAISWYFNNQLEETFSTTSAPFNTVFAGQNSMFLILTESAGCTGYFFPPPYCPGQTSPLNMQVQWVHVYASPPT